MTEFNLTNGQAIELTKDGILIKGNRIEIDGNITIVKDDKHANVVEQDDEGTKISIVNIDDDLKASANNGDEAPESHLSPFEKLKSIKKTFSELDDEPKIMNPYTNSKSKRGLGDITINVKVEVDDSELKQLGEKYSQIGRAITEAFENGK